MNADWQSIAAPVIVGMTLTVFVWRYLGRRRGPGGCAGCACPPKPAGDIHAGDKIRRS